MLVVARSSIRCFAYLDYVSESLEKEERERERSTTLKKIPDIRHVDQGTLSRRINRSIDQRFA